MDLTAAQPRSEAGGLIPETVRSTAAFRGSTRATPRLCTLVCTVLAITGCGRDDPASESQDTVVPPTVGPPVTSGNPDPDGPSHVEGWTSAELLEQMGVNMYGATTGLTEQDWVEFSLEACATPDDPDAMPAIADEYGLRGGWRPDAEIVSSMNPFMGTACPGRYGR